MKCHLILRGSKLMQIYGYFWGQLCISRGFAKPWFTEGKQSIPIFMTGVITFPVLEVSKNTKCIRSI